MKRGAPLRRSASIRDSYLKKLKERGTVYAPRQHVKKDGKVYHSLTRKKPLKKIGRSKRNKLKSYFALTKEFLALPENEFCGVCRALGYSHPNPATEVHHQRGRNGRLLTDTRFWIPSCYYCRLWPHENPALARQLGLLSSASEWNVFPSETCEDSQNVRGSTP